VNLIAVVADPDSVPREEIPAALGALESLKAMLLSRLLEYRAERQVQPDHLLNVDEAAQQLNASADWLYRNADKLPFTVRVGRNLRFSAQGVQRYIRSRAGR
jgi:predicted DNA-binding transcriptional regulator AlpA